MSYQLIEVKTERLSRFSSLFIYFLGQTVEVLKSYVESEYGIPMGLQTLFLENLLMMDPLSLLDFAEAKGEHIFVS